MHNSKRTHSRNTRWTLNTDAILAIKAFMQWHAHPHSPYTDCLLIWIIIYS